MLCPFILEKRKCKKMIHESYYWKKELYKSFGTLAKFIHLKKPTEQSYVKVEKALMFGAYTIRKLNEAQKIPPDFLQKKETLEFFESKKTIVDHMNWHKIDKHYTFNQLNNIDKDWRFILNQIIHSFSLIFSFDESKRLNGFLVNSDKTKKYAIFLLPVELIFKIFLTISEGDIVSANSSREIIGKEANGRNIYGEMKLRQALYSYSEGFDLNEIITQTMNGDIYVRNEKNW